jgi:hypothetical protein
MFLDNLDDYLIEQELRESAPLSPGEVSAIQRAMEREQRAREAAERGEVNNEQ